MLFKKHLCCSYIPEAMRRIVYMDWFLNGAIIEELTLTLTLNTKRDKDY